MSEHQTKAGNQENSKIQIQNSNVYVDPWDMLNNFCFHVYAQKSLFMGENGTAFFDIHNHPICETGVH